MLISEVQILNHYYFKYCIKIQSNEDVNCLKCGSGALNTDIICCKDHGNH